MGGNTPGNYEYTLEGSVSDAKVLTLKANVPVPMGGIDINFIQGETPIAYYVASTYQYDTNLAISVRELRTALPKIVKQSLNVHPKLR